MLKKSNSQDNINLKIRFENKVQQGFDLLKSIDSLYNISGISKVRKKIKQEIGFLNKMMDAESMKEEHLLSTNLNHFHALVDSILKSNDVISTLETKSYNDSNNISKKLCIDIVCEKGSKWIKVIARNPKALSQILSGEGDFGQKSIVDHGLQYRKCADQNHFMFGPPDVCFNFAAGVTKTLSNSLKKLNIQAIGNLIHEDNISEETYVQSNEGGQCYSKINHPLNSDRNIINSIEPKLSNNPALWSNEISILNLDVSTMMAYVSALTNGGCNFTFREPLLNQQAGWEKLRPLKPILDDIFHGKSLICCETARNSFMEIVNVLGGPSEKERSKNLMDIVKVVSDKPIEGIKVGGKIKPRSLIIFGSGYHYRAVTVTANEGFIRAAKHQNANFAVIVHESRALSEIKQQKCII